MKKVGEVGCYIHLESWQGRGLWGGLPLGLSVETQREAEHPGHRWPREEALGQVLPPRACPQGYGALGTCCLWAGSPEVGRLESGSR